MSVPTSLAFCDTLVREESFLPVAGTTMLTPSSLRMPGPHYASIPVTEFLLEAPGDVIRGKHVVLPALVGDLDRP